MKKMDFFGNEEPVLLYICYPTDDREYDSRVLKFIDRFYGSAVNDDGVEAIRKTFRAGYCLYFAEILKAAFERGSVCWAAPFGHMVWVDDKEHGSVPYDIEGIYYGEALFFIPVEYLGDCVWDFRHTPGKEYKVSIKQDVFDIIKRYCSDTGQEYNEVEIAQFV